MATREELLIIARLQDRATRPVQELRQEFDRLHREIGEGEKVTASQRAELRRLGHEMKRAQRDAQELAKRWADASRQAMQFVTLPVVAGMALMTKAASDLEQAVGGTESMFGRSAHIIDEWAKTAARSAGLSERAAREATSQIGALLQGFGFTVEASAHEAIRLTQLGADLAATFGGTVQQAVDAVGAALRGEFNPLERFGVALNVAQINAHAVAMGLASSTAEVTLAIRAQAALDLIMRRTTNAQGQFGREAEMTAGRLAIAKAEFENAAAEFGENLLPVVARGIGLLTDLTRLFTALPEPVQTTILAIAGIAAAVGPVAWMVSNILKLRAALLASETAARLLSTTALTRLIPTLRTAGIVAAGAAAVFLVVKNRWDSVSAGLDDAAERITKRWQLDLNTIEGLEEAAKRWRQAEEQLRSQDTGSLWNPFNWRNKISTHMAADAAGRAASQYEHMAEAAIEADEAVKASAAAAGEGADRFAQLEEALDRTNQAWQRLIGNAIRVEELRLGLEESALRFAERIASEAGVTEADELQFLLGQMRRIHELVAAEQREGLTPAGSTAAFERQLEIIDSLITQFPRLRDEADQYMRRLRTGAESLNAAVWASGGAAGIAGAIGAGVASVGSGLGAGVWGDTARPMSDAVAAAARNGGSTLAAWGAVDAMVPGRRRVTSHIRTFGLGSADSDHHPSRAAAVDVAGDNLPATAAMVRRLGGFAELHGHGASRHLHVVPPAVPAGRGGDHYQVTINAGGGLDARQLAREVRREIRALQRDDERRLR